MSVLATVALLEFLITISVVLIGTCIYKLSPWATLLAALFVCPVPVFVVGTSSAGFIYFADLIGLFVLVTAAARGRFNLSTLNGGRVTYRLALLLLVLVPLVASGITTIRDGNGDLRWIILGVLRGLSYVFIFTGAARYAAKRPQSVKPLICVQAISITATCGIGILQFFLNWNLDLWNEYANYDFTEWIGGFGHGFMGLYRGAIGAWTAGMAAVIVSATYRQRFGIVLAAAFISLSLAANILVGSRQGLVGTLIGLIVSILLASRSRKVRASRHWIGIVLAICFLVGSVFALGGNGISQQGRDVEDWLSHRFDLFSSGSEAIDEAKNRDPRMPVVLDRIANEPWNYLIGLGYGRVVPEPVGVGLDLIYVDSELLWTLQQTGFLGLTLYLLMLAFIVTRISRAARWKAFNQPDQLVMGGALICVGVFLTYGHFFLLHVQSSQAPVSYWNWLMLGFCMALPARDGTNLNTGGSK